MSSSDSLILGLRRTLGFSRPQWSGKSWGRCRALKLRRTGPHGHSDGTCQPGTRGLGGTRGLCFPEQGSRGPAGIGGGPCPPACPHSTADHRTVSMLRLPAELCTPGCRPSARSRFCIEGFPAPSPLPPGTRRLCAGRSSGPPRPAETTSPYSLTTREGEEGSLQRGTQGLKEAK